MPESMAGSGIGRRAHVLVVEGDSTAVHTYRELLEDAGYRVSVAETGRAAKAAVEQDPPDLIVLDLGLPDADGLVLCGDLRARVSAPIVVCTASADKRDFVLAFRLGADDFLTKPFDVEQFLARVGAALRRSQPRRPSPRALPAHREVSTPWQPQPTVGPANSTGRPTAEDGSGYRVGNLTIDRVRHVVTVDGRPLTFTPTEFRILLALASHPGGLVSRDELAARLWAAPGIVGNHALGVHIRRLRIKLGSLPVPGPVIENVRGSGYRLEPSEATAAA